jgi:hypothetical protein
MLFLAETLSDYLAISACCEYMHRWHSLCSEFSRYAEGFSSEVNDVTFSFSGEDGYGDVRPVSRMQEGL